MIATDAAATHDGLMSAILADPADDAPHLVFADWLEERGDVERAEFVRVQVELARTKVRPNGHTDFGGVARPFVNEDRDCTRPDCRACALRRRERELFGPNQFDWFKRGDQWFQSCVFRLDARTIGPRPEVSVFDVRRGWPSAVSLSLTSLVGGPCGTCEGRRWDYGECRVCGATPDDDGEVFHGRGCYTLDENGGGSEFPEPCPACSGTGRTPGIAAKLASLPLESVRIVDREPVGLINEDVTRHWRWDDDGNHPQHGREYIPTELAEFLGKPSVTAPSHARVGYKRWDYSTADAALDALSTASLRFIRAAGE